MLLILLPQAIAATELDRELSGSLKSGPSYYHEVIPVLSKLGCSSGACHGSPNGKKGFRLSLRGYDPPADAQAIIRDDFGRRVDVLSPESSLLLKKPIMAVHHGGGKRLSLSDPSYAVLRDWIAHGCSVAPPQSECTGIHFETSDELVLSAGKDKHQLRVWATFADGTRRDVTQLSVFSSSDLGVVAVDDQGLTQGVARGQAGVSARYLEHWRTLSATVTPSTAVTIANRQPQRNVIDELIDSQLEKLQFEPASLCTDEQFIRRAYLDVIGLLPTIPEVDKFLKDADQDKRKYLIEHLLGRPEHARFWALKWGDLLRLNKQLVGAEGVQKYSRWLVRAFENNMPYDQFVRELLAAQGSTLENPPANYYRTTVDVNNTIETTAQVFMGVRLECCKCHNHPMEKWTQDNYYGFAAFFNRVQRKPSRRTGDLIIWIDNAGEVTHPRTGLTMQPWLPSVGEVTDLASTDRRIAFVDWLTAKDNPFMATVEVNRIWSHLLGRGIVEPVDDFRDSNPPSNPKLLSALAADFIAHGFDRKHTMRLIMNSRTYQSSSTATPDNAADERYFSHYRSRLLSAEQLLDAIGSFTELPEQFRGLPIGTRATQLAIPEENNEFLEVFGQPKRQTACQCERVSEVTLAQLLQIANGKLIHEKLTAPRGRIQRLVRSSTQDSDIVKELFMAAYSRLPSDQEQLTIASFFAKRNQRETAITDLAWALINSNEFLMQR